jgi:hypothetical protein
MFQALKKLMMLPYKKNILAALKRRAFGNVGCYNPIYLLNPGWRDASP